jgi:aryl-alcohol dehydrogenase-like predicted oxidoreductase
MTFAVESVNQKFHFISGKTVPEVALRWLLQKNVVSSVIIGCTSIQQLEDNVGASGGWEISAEGVLFYMITPYKYDLFVTTLIS